MSLEGIVLSAFITIFSLGLFLVSLASYLRVKKLKLLTISCVFILFFIKGIAYSIGLMYPDFSEVLPLTLASGLFDLSMLLLFFVATLRR